MMIKNSKQKALNKKMIHSIIPQHQWTWRRKKKFYLQPEELGLEGEKPVEEKKEEPKPKPKPVVKK